MKTSGIVVLASLFYSASVAADEELAGETEPAAYPYTYIPREEMTCSLYDPDFCFEEHGWSLQDYLSPHVLEQVPQIREQLRAGKVVTIEEAFRPEFTHAMHQELLHLNYNAHELYEDDGFHIVHHSIYSKDDYTNFMHAADIVFQTDETRAFMNDLSGRDCNGDVKTGTSWFAPGDYAAPHNDQVESRSVTFVWHLAKDWKPEWGGALFWLPERREHSYTHASFNTLTLFVVQPHMNHMVTQVSPYATGKRLAWNVWWHSSWTPNAEDDLESYMDTEDKRKHLTVHQKLEIRELLDNDELKPDVHARVEYLLDLAEEEIGHDPILVHRIRSY
jgi:hypothetical protein